MFKKSIPYIFVFNSIILYGQSHIEKIDKLIVSVGPSLLASKTEVTNKQYQQFLTSLQVSKQDSLLEIVKIDTSNWSKKEHYNPSYGRYYATHPAYANYPVVNVSYEGAQQFCLWLTATYNSDPKRKFKKVSIRLPTQNEWMEAAKGGDSLAIYPWKGKELRSKKGLYLCNFSSEPRPIDSIQRQQVAQQDLFAPVNAYEVNNFGLYCMSGNVAEMTSERGILKGGSWRNKQAEMQITKVQTNHGESQVDVGFRFFVQILEK